MLNLIAGAAILAALAAITIAVHMVNRRRDRSMTPAERQADAAALRQDVARW